MSKEEIYKLGFDAGKNGANTTNCDFRCFSTPENKDEWQRGYDKGKLAPNPNNKK